MAVAARTEDCLNPIEAVLEAQPVAMQEIRRKRAAEDDAEFVGK